MHAVQSDLIITMCASSSLPLAPLNCDIRLYGKGLRGARRCSTTMIARLWNRTARSRERVRQWGELSDDADPMRFAVRDVEHVVLAALAVFYGLWFGYSLYRRQQMGKAA